MILVRTSLASAAERSAVCCCVQESFPPEDRPAFFCPKHMVLGNYARCAAAGCASNTRGVFACLSCFNLYCGRTTHMGVHAAQTHKDSSCVAAYFGISKGCHAYGSRRDVQYYWCYQCASASTTSAGGAN